MNRKRTRYWIISGTLLILLTAILWVTIDRNNIRQNAVTTAQYYATNPAPTPSFITRLKPAPGEIIVSGEQICATLSVGYFLNSNENIDTVRAFLGEHTRITINGEFPFVYESFSYFWRLANLPNGKPNAALSYCLMESLASGIYSAVLKIQDTAGKQYDYTWAFNIK